MASEWRCIIHSTAPVVSAVWMAPTKLDALVSGFCVASPILRADSSHVDLFFWFSEIRRLCGRFAPGPNRKRFPVCQQQSAGPAIRIDRTDRSLLSSQHHAAQRQSPRIRHCSDQTKHNGGFLLQPGTAMSQRAKQLQQSLVFRVRRLESIRNGIDVRNISVSHPVHRRRFSNRHTDQMLRGVQRCRSGLSASAFVVRHRDQAIHDGQREHRSVSAAIELRLECESDEFLRSVDRKECICNALSSRGSDESGWGGTAIDGKVYSGHCETGHHLDVWW